MATLRKQIALDTGATTVWAALRDFDAVHTRVAPGFLTDLKMDGDDRIVTFFNGMVARASDWSRATTRTAGWSIRSWRAARRTTTRRCRSSPRATAAAASSGRSTCCRTNSHPRSAA